MKIVLSNQVAFELETIAVQARGLEFSGFGFVERREDHLYVYDYVLLNIGSTGFTEIDSKDILELMKRSDAGNMKLWYHMHPVGNGIPGEHNWSATDRHTILHEPLGGIPQLVRWSASIVRTPLGWVGRIDNYINRTVVHVNVEPAVPREVFSKVQSLISERDLGFSMSYDEALTDREIEDLFGDEFIDEEDELADQVFYYPESFSQIGLVKKETKKRRWPWQR
jgi:hypothetical protein